MKKFSMVLLCLFAIVTLKAQDSGQKFSPEKFKAEMECFITKDACLTQKEAAKFFPLYNEMKQKSRVIFDRMRQLGKNKPADESGCRDVIRQRDKLDLELKKIQQTYHEKFLTVISASKLFDVIKAEEKFHRRMLKKANGDNTHQKKKK
ncbi:MAG: hypothetical protein K2G86_09045 [Prevotella sp.]|nr:hypothetical protein [Prevotella sp.]MDE6354381.1 hypothetical protein [Prevotella sp.]